MFKKTMLTAAALAMTLGALSPAAQATEDSTVIRDHRTKTEVRDHRTNTEVRDHRTKTEVRDHRTPPRQNEVVPVTAKKLSCQTGYEKLWWRGYSSINASDCSGVTYSYRAIRDDMIFRADMNAYSGAIQVTMLGFAH